MINLKKLIDRFSTKNPELATKLATLTGNDEKIFRQAQALIEVADELDAVDPEMAAEADILLKELVANCGSCSKCSVANMDSEKLMMDQMAADVPLQEDMAGAQKMQYEMDPEEDDDVAELDFENLSLNDVREEIDDDTANPDPEINIEIEEIDEQTDEYDLVNLDELRSRAELMKWKMTDRKAKAAIESAIEYIEKAQNYHAAKKTHLNKVHSIFDEAGLPLRMKDFD